MSSLQVYWHSFYSLIASNKFIEYNNVNYYLLGYFYLGYNWTIYFLTLEKYFQYFVCVLLLLHIVRGDEKEYTQYYK